jgi:hypothetical protein
MSVTLRQAKRLIRIVIGFTILTITKTQWSDRGFTWLTGLAPVGGEFHRLRIVWLKRRKLHIVLPNAA